MTSENVPVRIAVLGMEREHLELLPALFKDPRVDICWVYCHDSESAIAHLASLFSFPVVTEPPDSQTVHDLDILIQPEQGAIRFEPAQKNGLQIISDRQLASMRNQNGFDWKNAIDDVDDVADAGSITSSLESQASTADPDPLPGDTIDSTLAPLTGGNSNLTAEVRETVESVLDPDETELPESKAATIPPDAEQSTRHSILDSTQDELSKDSPDRHESLNDSEWVQGMTCSPNRSMPDKIPAWFPRLINPKRLGAWICDHIDCQLSTPLPCILVLTRRRRILGTFDALGRPGSQMRRSVYRFLKLTTRPEFIDLNFEALKSEQPVTGPFNLHNLPTGLFEDCGFKRSGTFLFRMPLQKKHHAWLLYFNSIDQTNCLKHHEIPPLVIRHAFAEQRMAIETLTKLTIDNEQARQWRLLQSMGRKLNLVSRSIGEINLPQNGNQSERYDD